ncbi:MAG TPA: glucose 1-dehydrogenase [Acidothermaceae bacterium]|nr:glucose 1-dehydrogenase [Acidothermaceae bacterium]
MGRFDGQVAIVTGSGAGIGQAIAARLAEEGGSVCVADVDLPSAEAAASRIRDLGHHAVARQMDVTDRASVVNAVGWTKVQLGPVDVLINNAAACNDTPLLDLTEADWDRDVDVTLKGAFFCAQAVLPDMQARGSGSIVNLGSVNGFHYLGNAAYSAAKAGLVSLTRSLGVRYGRDGIRTNMVAPGTIRTAAWDDRLARDPHVLDDLAKWYPLGRVGTVEDVAAAVAFLASREASWITGTVLTVDGGLLAGNAPMVADIFNSTTRMSS